MPYKFQKHMPKGFSWKASKAKNPYLVKSVPQLLSCVMQKYKLKYRFKKQLIQKLKQMTQVLKTVGVQTDKDQVKVAESQTNTTEIYNVEVQTDEPLSRDEPSYCIGNYDDKFIPLIAKCFQRFCRDIMHVLITNFVFCYRKQCSGILK